MNKIDLQGRHAVITGGAQGIGYAVAERLLASGASVSIWDRDEAMLNDAVSRLSEQGTASGLVADVTEPASVAMAAEATAQQSQRIDILVASAGIAGPNKTTWEYPVDEWQRVIQVNLLGVFHSAAVTEMGHMVVS